MEWPRISLGDVLDLADSGVWGAEDKRDGISVLRSTNFCHDGTLDLGKLALRGIPGETRVSKILEPGDILLERSGGSPRQPVGRVCFFAGDSRPHTFSNFCQRLRSRKGLCNSRFLFWYLHHFHTSGGTLAFQKQTTGIRNLDYKPYLKQDIPLPALPEQRRIVEILDQADRVRRLRAEADAKADRILPALFIKMFGDPATNPMGWPKRTIGRLAMVTTGNTPSRKKLELYGNHIEWVKSDNLNTPSHYITPTAEYLSEDGARVGRTAQPGSTLVTCIAGSPGAIGNAAFADREVAFNQQINAATPREGVHPYFLYAQFVIGRRLVQAASTEGMKGLVSKSRFSTIQFLAPPPELQKRFGVQCKVLCDQNELRVQQAAKLNKHFTVLLHLAFSGDLTAGWREAHMNELLQEMEQQAKALAEMTP